jgi:hypothetical protein
MVVEQMEELEVVVVVTVEAMEAMVVPLAPQAKPGLLPQMVTLVDLVVVAEAVVQHQGQQVQHYQATQDKLVKGNYYEHTSKKN